MFGGSYQGRPDVFGECGVRGLFQVQDFVSEEEERDIVRMLDASGWKFSDQFNGRYCSQSWGVVTDHRANTFRNPDPARGERAMPPMFAPLIERWRALAERSARVPVLRGHAATEANAISYYKDQGHHLEPHVDNRQVSGECLCTLSLLGGALMEFAHDRDGGRVVSSPMLPRSLQVVTGEARWDYTHGIPNGNLHGERRISITFRLPTPSRWRPS